MASNIFENDLSLIGEASRTYLARKHRMLIGGEWVEAASGKTFDVIDPTDGRVLASVPEGDAPDVDRAVKAARSALRDGPWAKWGPVQRERALLRLADLIERDGTLLSEVESVNGGRVLSSTRFLDVELSIDYLRYMAGWASKINGQTIEPSLPRTDRTRFTAMSLREPIGVVAAITPWNVPLGQAIWKLAPVLATGCTMVLKPAEQTPLTALRLGELVQEAGIPPGVLNVVTGFGPTAGAALVKHPGVDKIGFTGSTETGRQIGTLAAARMTHVTLELGGKSAMVVMDDADLDLAIPGLAAGIFSNHGQNCCAGSRMYVHSKVYDRVVDGVAQIARSIQLGSPLQPSTQMGPLISARQQERVLSYIQSGVEQGATLVAGGTPVGAAGCYVQPTLLADVRHDMRVVQEEIFGPVLGIMRFDDFDDVIARANDSQFGLGGSIWTTNLNRAHRFIAESESGMVWVNTHAVLDRSVPFGGFKQSGIGHELGEEAVRHHTRLKSAIIALDTRA